MNLVVDADDSVELERLKAVVVGTLHKSPKLKVVSISGHEVQAPGRPAEVIHEILEYLDGRKAKSAHQIARGIQRTDRSVYGPLKRLEELGKVETTYNAKYKMKQWKLVKVDANA